MASLMVRYSEAALQTSGTTAVESGSTSTINSSTSNLDSLQGIYLASCRSLGCKSNSYLMKTLSTISGDFDSLQALDLNLNFVGRVGIRAVLSVIHAAKRLSRLSLADNWLNNDAVKELTDVLKDHPGVQYVDLSRNPISHVAGRLLVEYASRNPAIHYIALDGTLIGSALLRLIQIKTTANRENAVKGLNPSILTMPAATAPQLTDSANALNERWEMKSKFISLLREAANKADSELDMSVSSFQESHNSVTDAEMSINSAIAGAIPTSNAPETLPRNEITASTTEFSKSDEPKRQTPIPQSTTSLASVSPMVGISGCGVGPAAVTSLGTLFQIIKGEDNSQDFVGMALLGSVAKEHTPEGVLSLLLNDPPDSGGAAESKPDSEAAADDDGLHGISCAEELAEKLAGSAGFQQQDQRNTSPYIDPVESPVEGLSPSSFNHQTTNGSFLNGAGIRLLWAASQPRISSLSGISLLCQISQHVQPFPSYAVPIPKSRGVTTPPTSTVALPHSTPWYGMRLVSVLLHRNQTSQPPSLFTQQWQALPVIIQLAQVESQL